MDARHATEMKRIRTCPLCGVRFCQETFCSHLRDEHEGDHDALVWHLNREIMRRLNRKDRTPSKWTKCRKLKEVRDDCEKYRSNCLYWKERAQSTDPWHPASEPPKLEDFEPTWNIDIGWFVKDERPRATEVGKHSIGLYKDWTHWRKITPPK